MTIKCNCPTCGSRNTKSLQVIYESGQRVGRSTRNSLYASLSGSVWAGRSTTESHSSSLISAHAAPPAPLPWPVIGIPLVVGVVVFHWPIWVVPVVMFSIAILYGSSNAWAQRLKEANDWHKSFQCLRCGTVFMPEEEGVRLEPT